MAVRLQVSPAAPRLDLKHPAPSQSTARRRPWPKKPTETVGSRFKSRLCLGKDPAHVPSAVHLLLCRPLLRSFSHSTPAARARPETCVKPPVESKERLGRTSLVWKKRVLGGFRPKNPFTGRGAGMATTGRSLCEVRFIPLALSFQSRCTLRALRPTTAKPELAGLHPCRGCVP